MINEESHVNPDAEPKLGYYFLEKMAADHPDLAKNVASKIPRWKEWLNKRLPSSQIAETLLDSFD